MKTSVNTKALIASLSTVLDDARRARGMSIQEFADAIGASVSTARRRLNGGSSEGAWKMREIAAAALAVGRTPTDVLLDATATQ